MARAHYLLHLINYHYYYCVRNAWEAGAVLQGKDTAEERGERHLTSGVNRRGG